MNLKASFDKLLAEAHVVGMPGSGFGPSVEGYFRLTVFGSREETEERRSSGSGAAGNGSEPSMRSP